MSAGAVPAPRKDKQGAPPFCGDAMRSVDHLIRFLGYLENKAANLEA